MTYPARWGGSLLPLLVLTGVLVGLGVGAAPGMAAPGAGSQDSGDPSESSSPSEPASVGATPEPDTLMVSLPLQDAVDQALDRGQAVGLAQEQILRAEEEIDQVRAGALPRVTGDLNYNRALRTIFDDLSAPPPANEEDGEENPFADLPFGRPNTWIASLRVTQPLYVGGRVRTGLEIADQVRESLRHNLTETELETVLEVRDTYFQAVFAERLLEIAEGSYELAEAQLRQVESFAEQGTASDFDVLTARVERDNLEPEIVQARNARDVAVLNLKRLVNLPEDAKLDLTTSLDVRVAEVDPNPLREAARDRPVVRAAQEQISIGQGQVRIAQADYLPTVSAFAEFGWQAFPESVSPFDDNWREDWNVGLQVSIPIFNGFETRARIREAQSGVRSAELELEQLWQSLHVELEATLGEFDRALAQIEARRATVGEAERAVELAELRFAAGSATALELSNARLLLQQARVNEAQALIEYVNALSRLERAAGGQVPLLNDRLTTPSPAQPGDAGGSQEREELER